jgi:hypothetical protein
VVDLQQELRKRNLEAVADNKDVLLDRLWAALEQQSSSSSDSSHASSEASSSSHGPQGSVTSSTSTTGDVDKSAAAFQDLPEPSPPPPAAAAAAPPPPQAVAAGGEQPPSEPYRVSQTYARHVLPDGSVVWLPRSLPLDRAQQLCAAAAGVPLQGLPPFPLGRLGRLYDTAQLRLKPEEEFAVLAVRT